MIAFVFHVPLDTYRIPMYPDPPSPAYQTSAPARQAGAGRCTSGRVSQNQAGGFRSPQAEASLVDMMWPEIRLYAVDGLMSGRIHGGDAGRQLLVVAGVMADVSKMAAEAAVTIARAPVAEEQPAS